MKKWVMQSTLSVLHILSTVLYDRSKFGVFWNMMLWAPLQDEIEKMHIVFTTLVYGLHVIMGN